MIITTIIQLITSFGKYYNYFQYTCIDFLSVESLPYIWIEWISTIPLMLFLVNTINIHDKVSYIYTSSTDLKISENDSSNNNDMNMTESELSPSNGSTIVDSESEHVNAKIKALVVDDSSMNRKMVRRLLLLKGKLYV
jgi:hypothetical protein